LQPDHEARHARILKDLLAQQGLHEPAFERQMQSICEGCEEYGELRHHEADYSPFAELLEEADDCNEQLSFAIERDELGIEEITPTVRVHMSNLRRALAQVIYEAQRLLYIKSVRTDVPDLRGEGSRAAAFAE